jgi:undecaprenyl-diphosphatase
MDQKLLFLINLEWTSPALDWVMAVASSTALWKVPLAVLALAVLVMGGFRARAFVIVSVLTFLLSDSVVGFSIKKAVGRLRPYQSEFGVRQIELARPPWKGLFQPVKEKFSSGTERDGVGSSFPSNHASNNAAVALLAAIFFRRFGWAAFVPAGVVAYSRIYTGVHWPSDVLAGICLGMGVALLVLVLVESLWRRFGRRLAPGLALQYPSLLSSAA